MGLSFISTSSSTKVMPTPPATWSKALQKQALTSHNHTRQAESRLVQVPDRWGLLLGRRRLSRGGRSDRLGCHRHLAHRSVVQTAGNPSQLCQLQNKRTLNSGHIHRGYLPGNYLPDGEVTGARMALWDFGVEGSLWKNMAGTDISTQPAPQLQCKASLT